MSEKMCDGVCGETIEVPEELANGVTVCNRPLCVASFEARYPPGYWTPIEDTLPGGRYDGVWENSGMTLGERDE